MGSRSQNAGLIFLVAKRRTCLKSAVGLPQLFNALSGVTMEEDALPREASGGQEEVN